jgi:hypothetical protein
MNIYVSVIIVAGIAAIIATLRVVSRPKTVSTRASVWALFAGGKSDRVGIAYFGTATLLTQVFHGDSRNLVIDLEETTKEKRSRFEAYFAKDKEDFVIETSPWVRMYDVKKNRGKAFLEVELFAAGFTVSGENKQRQRIGTGQLHYHWNCFFPNSGVHEFTIIAREVTDHHGDEETKDIARFQRRVRVATLDHLTARHIQLITWGGAIVAGVVGIAQALHAFGVF